MGSFDATGFPPARAEQVLNNYKETVVFATDTPAATWNVASVHMGTTPGSLIDPPVGKSVVITEVVATYNASVTATVPFSFILCEEGSNDDIVRLSCNGGGPATWKGLYKLSSGKDLQIGVGQLASGNTGCVTVTYVEV
jgi:hypothetical protein